MMMLSAVSSFSSSPSYGANKFSGLVLTRNKAPKGEDGKPIEYLDSFVYLTPPNAIRPAVVIQALGSRTGRARTAFELPRTWQVLRSDATETTPNNPPPRKKGDTRMNTRLVVSSSVAAGKDGITLTYTGKAKSLKGITLDMKLLKATRGRVRWDFTAKRDGETLPKEQLRITRPDMKNPVPPEAPVPSSAA